MGGKVWTKTEDERQDELFPGGDSKYTIEALRDRLRELDEKNQTQAHCLAARAEKIDRLEAELSVRRSATKWLEKQISVRSAKCETCFDNYAKATGKLAERAEAAEAEVKRLRVCGNCRHFETVCGEGKCFVECEKPAWRFDKEVKYAEGNGKCDKWEAADNG